jgi:hypothetical protein
MNYTCLLSTRLCCSAQRPTATSDSLIAKENMTWILIGLGVAGVSMLLSLSKWSHREEEMGAVSRQWLAEYRQNHEG